LGAHELHDWIGRQDAPFVLDVRFHKEWVQGHIREARHVEAGALAEVAQSIAGNGRSLNGRPLVVHCAHGNRSTVALSILEQQGFKNLYALEDGIASWTQAGCEIVQGE
jgi:hydroxyacylglutathione hydrolase